MKRSFRWVAGPVMLLSAISCASQGAATGAPAAPAPSGAATPAAPAAPAAAATPADAAMMSVYDGVYTAAQADRGDQTQRRECSACHSTNDWAAGRLLGGWNGRSAFDLVSHIRNTMPMDSPGRLSLEQYTDIVAFIFELNDIPAGDTEMAPEEAALRQITVEYRR
jgi:S-disulfanyl-L-cysteine oxidoreductase SoxD